VAGKFGGGGGQGSVKKEVPTAAGRFSIAPSLQITPGTAPYFTTDLKLTTRILGGRVDFGVSVFANSPVSKDSPFKTNYDDKTNILTVTTAPPLPGSGVTTGITARF
jgi:hypothetical protein